MGAKALHDLPLVETAVDDATADAPVDVIEIAGTIKWFDISKGYGFIQPDNGLPDILLHVTCLRRDGYQTALEGARVVCEALAQPKGLQCFRILSIDESSALHPAQREPSQMRVEIEPTSSLVTARRAPITG